MLPMPKRAAARPWVLTACLALTACGAAPAEHTRAAPQSAARAQPALTPHWLGTWAASQQIPEPHNTLPSAALSNATLRQIVHLSVGGHELRVRFSNVFGTTALRIVAAHIAVPVSRRTGQIDPHTDTPLTFAGRPGVSIAPGAAYDSDPVAFDAKPLSDLAITLYLRTPPARQTSHPGARETSFLLHGDHVGAAKLTHAMRFSHWFFLSGVDVRVRGPAAAIVTLGDSITDGHATADNSDTRWPDDLARRLQASPATAHLSVLNVGTGGNRLLRYGLGPDALARFDRDVLAQTGVRELIVLEGVNDLGMAGLHGPMSGAGNAALVRHILGAYRQMILLAHAHGITVIGATITPFRGSSYYHPAAAILRDRRAINAWIRTPGHFDAVVDFARVVRDPRHPQQLAPRYDSGDHLHPNAAGYQAMANAIPLQLLRSAAAADGRRCP